MTAIPDARTPAYRGEVVLPLTTRQREVLYLVAHGETATGIAALLGISPATAQNLSEHARRRLGARTLAEAVYRLVKTARHWHTEIAGCKVCARCGRVKRLEEFHPDRRARSGRKSYCKPCGLAANRRRYALQTSARRAAGDGGTTAREVTP